MKLSTFLNRTKGISKSSNGYKNAMAILKTGDRQYTCHTSGSGRFTSNIDSTADTIYTLKRAGLKQGIDFVFDNDSPRGGKTGNYIELTSRGRRKLING